MKISLATAIDFVLFMVAVIASMFYLETSWWLASLVGCVVYVILSLVYFGIATVFNWPRGKPFDFVINLVLLIYP